MNKIVKKIIKNIPLVGRQAYNMFYPTKPFTGSENYWINRYKEGGNSGKGSYSNLAEFKAEIINQFVYDYNIENIIEFGVGDGNQLSLSKYPKFTGFDVSPDAISLCKSKFGSDSTKTFFLMDDYVGQIAELTMSLDVIYHLTEDEIFHGYMETLFNSSSRFSIIYSSNTDENSPDGASHVRHRKFTDWIDKNRPNWNLLKKIPNRYPRQEYSKKGSFADFYIYENSQAQDLR